MSPPLSLSPLSPHPAAPYARVATRNVPSASVGGSAPPAARPRFGAAPAEAPGFFRRALRWLFSILGGRAVEAPPSTTRSFEPDPLLGALLNPQISPHDFHSIRIATAQGLSGVETPEALFSEPHAALNATFSLTGGPAIYQAHYKTVDFCGSTIPSLIVRPVDENKPYPSLSITYPSPSYVAVVFKPDEYSEGAFPEGGLKAFETALLTAILQQARQEPARNSKS